MKYEVLNAIKEFTQVGLKEACDRMRNAPSILKEGISREDAMIIKESVEAAGGVCKIK